MIKRVTSERELARLPEKGTEAGKIRAMLLSYGIKYDFCRFFFSDSVIIGEMSGCFVLCELGECDFEELADFFSFGGFLEIFCSEKAGRALSKPLECWQEKVNLMRYSGEAISEEVEKDPPLDKVFEVLSSAFPINYELWYTDMSHRIRHGVTRLRMLENSTLTIQYELNGEAFLSQIATKTEFRGKGNASRLISAVCAELEKSAVYLVCEDSLRGFYERLGFVKTQTKFLLLPNKRRPFSGSLRRRFPTNRKIPDFFKKYRINID